MFWNLLLILSAVLQEYTTIVTSSKSSYKTLARKIAFLKEAYRMKKIPRTLLGIHVM